MSQFHVCVGFYPNGEFRSSTISDEKLQESIDFNKAWRPGRFYFVDGEYVCGGLLVEPKKSERIEKFKNMLKEMDLKPDYDAVDSFE